MVELWMWMEHNCGGNMNQQGRTHSECISLSSPPSAAPNPILRCPWTVFTCLLHSAKPMWHLGQVCPLWAKTLRHWRPRHWRSTEEGASITTEWMGSYPWNGWTQRPLTHGIGMRNWLTPLSLSNQPLMHAAARSGPWGTFSCAHVKTAGDMPNMWRRTWNGSGRSHLRKLVAHATLWSSII